MRKNDYQAFASSFLDLWQEQISRAMSDTDFLQSLMENMQQMQSGMFGHDTAAQQNHIHPAHASEPQSDELADMQRRLAAAERKIIKLEAAYERLCDAQESTVSTPSKPKPAAAIRPKPVATRPKPVAAKAAPKPQPKPAQKPKPKAKASAKPALRKRAVKRR